MRLSESAISESSGELAGQVKVTYNRFMDMFQKGGSTLGLERRMSLLAVVQREVLR